MIEFYKDISVFKKALIILSAITVGIIVFALSILQWF